MTINKKEIAGLTFAILIFLINPILGIFVTILISLSYKSEFCIVGLIVMLSTFLGLINTTKFLESDIIGYSNIFELSKKQSFIKYIKEIGKEPLYYSFMYLFGKVLNTNFKFFLLIQTFIAYFFYLYSIFRFQNKLALNRLSVLFSLGLATLFFELFSLSAHIMRQFLAASLLLYYIVIKIFYDQNKWWYLISVIFIHSTTILFVPLIFFSFLKKKINTNRIFLVILISGTIIFLLPIISILIVDKMGIGIFTYIFYKSLEPNFDDGVQVSKIAIFINIFLFIYSLTRNYIIKIYNVHEIHFNHIIIFLTIFIIILINQPLLAYRFSFYSYFILPMIMPIVLSRKTLGSFFPYLGTIIIAFMIFRFMFKLENGVFTYASLSNILSSTIFNYL